MITVASERPGPKGVTSAFGYPWSPDTGDGHYLNPVLYADYSDPDVVRVGEDFYLTASSFNCTPGLPILHSRDLVNWTLIAHAVKNLPHPRYSVVQPGCGVWAPAIRHHAGKFWIFFPMPDEGIYMTTADHPAGPWAEPHLVQAGKGLIDPCPLWDDDGKAYLVHAYAHSRSGLKHQLRVRPMSPDGARLLGEGQIVFHDPERHPTLEGPKFLKRDGWYYILAPAGGVATGWQAVFRSRNIYGPYEDRIVLEQGNTPVNGPHQGALVDSATGDWWFIHFQDAGVYGRIVHLQPARWEEGWPLMGTDLDGNGIGEPVLRWPIPRVSRGHPIAAPQTGDEFNSPQLGLQWQWHANHQDDWYSLTARKSHLRLVAQPVPGGSLARSPNLLLQKIPARVFAVETLLDFTPTAPGEEAGLVVMGRDHSALALRETDGGRKLVFRVNDADHHVESAPTGPIRLRVNVSDGGVCTFSWATADGHFQSIPETFQAREGVWIGAKVGLYCLSRETDGKRGHADFDYFRFSAVK